MKRALLLLAFGACAADAGTGVCTSTWYRPGFVLSIDGDSPFPDGSYVWTIVRDGETRSFLVDVAAGWGQCTADGCARDQLEPGVLLVISKDTAYVEDWNGGEDDRPSASKIEVQVARGGWTMGSWRFFPMYQGLEANGRGCGVTWQAQYTSSLIVPLR